MIFLIKFIRPKKELAPFESKFADVPVVGKNFDDARRTFDKYLGKPYGYKITNISVIGYEED